LQKSQLKASPLVMELNNLDYWYWCKYFIDIYRHCPYECSYCNTKNQTAIRGINFIPGIPRESHTIGLGLLSDIYSEQKEENDQVKEILNILLKNRYSVNILTKSNTIIDDHGILKKFSEKDHVRITFTLLTLDNDLTRDLEGSSPTPKARLNALKFLSDHKIQAGIAITPIIPYVNDDRDSLSRLVKEAKKMGAKWVLFSGYNPTTNFLIDPRWKKSLEIHSATDKLNKRYRETKLFMINLLYNEGLPIRIPRIKLDLLNRRYHSHIASELLFNISYYYELLEDNIEAKRYLRAAYEIDNLSKPLMPLVRNNKLGYIKGINPEIESVIKEIINNNQSSFYKNLYKKLGLAQDDKDGKINC